MAKSTQLSPLAMFRLGVMTCACLIVGLNGYQLIEEYFRPDFQLNLLFLYEEEDIDANHTLKISNKKSSTSLEECEILGDRGTPIGGHKGKFFQSVTFPVDQFLRHFVDDVTTLEVTVKSNGTGLRENTITVYFSKNKVAAGLADVDVNLSADGNPKGNATYTKRDAAIPQISRKSQIAIKLSKVFQDFRYKMVFHRIDEYAKNLCPTNELGGQIDFSRYFGHFASELCMVDMERSELTLQPFSMPFGFIRLSVEISHPTKGSFIIHRYFFVKEDFDGSKKDSHFQEKSWPNADHFTLPWGYNLLIDTEKTEFAYKDFGLDFTYKPIISHERECYGHAEICTHVLTQKGPVVDVKLNKWNVNNTKQINLRIGIIWNFQFHKFSKTYRGVIQKTVQIMKNGLLVDIECVRNCFQRYSSALPGVLYAKCFNCKGKELEKITYRWQVDDRYAEVDGITTKYLTINSYTSSYNLKVSVEVTYEEGSSNKGNSTILKTKHTGRASREFEIAKNNRLWFKGSLEPTNLNTSDTFVMMVNVEPPSNIEGAFPITNFFHYLPSKDVSSRMELCSFVSPTYHIMLNQWRLEDAYIGIRTPGGKSSGHIAQFQKNHHWPEQAATSLKTHCRHRYHYDCVRSTTAILSHIQKLIEMDGRNWHFYEPGVIDCVRILIPLLRDCDYAIIKNVIFLQAMLIPAASGDAETEELIQWLSYLTYTQDILYHYTMQTSSEFERMTGYILTALMDTLIFTEVKGPQSRGWGKEKGLLEGLQDAMEFMIRNYETRGRYLNFTNDFPLGSGQMSGVWLDVNEAHQVQMEFVSKDLVQKITIPAALFKETLRQSDSKWALRSSEKTETNARYAQSKLQDTFFNVIAIMTTKQIFRDKGPELEFGSVMLGTELKTTNQDVQLLPVNHPIVVEFSKRIPERQFRSLPMMVVEKDGEVVDSTCLILEVARTDAANVTINFKFPEGYNYSFTAILAKYPSEAINFLDEPSKPVANIYSYYLPKVSTVDMYEYPFSKGLFMVRVVSGVQPKGRKRRRKGSPNLVSKTIFLRIDVLVTQCLYHNKKQWISDSKCTDVPQENPSAVRCHCFVQAPYSARKAANTSKAKIFTLDQEHYRGPTMLPNTIVMFFLVTFVFYAYWAYFLDIKEKDCMQTHAIKDMYDPRSTQQYLVCIVTGVMPRSGTDGRVQFVIIGENGSLQYVIDEGNHVHTTGSETWFILSSHLELGNIMGITVKYDKHVSGAILYPWFLKRVVVYCMSNNQVIVFESNHLLGIQLPVIELPTEPHTYRYGKETMIRFWRMLRCYHTVFSVLFHIPGTGVTNVLSALSSLFVVMAIFALAIEVVGGPTLVNHFHPQTKKLGLLQSISKLSPICLMLSIGIKVVYGLVFRIHVGTLWSNRPQPYEGYWQGGAPSKSWLSLVVDEETRKKHTFQLIETWLSKKRVQKRCKRRTHNTPVVSKKLTPSVHDSEPSGIQSFIGSKPRIKSYFRRPGNFASNNTWESIKVKFNAERFIQSTRSPKEPQRHGGVFSRVKNWKPKFLDKELTSGSTIQTTQMRSSGVPTPSHAVRSSEPRISPDRPSNVGFFSRMKNWAKNHTVREKPSRVRIQTQIVRTPSQIVPTSSERGGTPSQTVGTPTQTIGSSELRTSNDTASKRFFSYMTDWSSKSLPQNVSPGAPSVPVPSSSRKMDTASNTVVKYDDENKNQNDGSDNERELNSGRSKCSSTAACVNQEMGRHLVNPLRDEQQGSSSGTNDESVETSVDHGPDRSILHQQIQHNLHNLQLVTNDDLTVSASKTSSISSSYQGNTSIDASDEDSTDGQVTLNIRAQRKTKGSLSKQTKHFAAHDNIGSVRREGIGEIISGPRQISTPHMSGKLDCEFAPTRPNFVIAKHSEIFEVSRKNTKLNNWRIIGKDDDLNQSSQKKHCFGFLKTKPKTRCAAPDAFVSSKREAGSKRIMSFREYYYRPLLKWGNERQQVHTASPPLSDFQFLRKSRYLEKMVKDYDLTELIYSNMKRRADTCALFDSPSCIAKVESFNSLAQNHENIFRDHCDIINETLEGREVLNFPKPKLNRHNMDNEKPTNSKNNRRISETLCPSFKTFFRCKTKQERVRGFVLRQSTNKKHKYVTGKCAHSWLTRLCIQFEDSEKDSDSALEDSIAAKVSVTYALAASITSDQKSPAYTRTDIAHTEKDKCIARSDLLLKSESNYTGPRKDELCSKVNKGQDTGMMDSLRRLRAPRFTADTKLHEDPKYSKLASKGTLATLKRKALTLFTQFVIRNRGFANAMNSDTFSQSSSETPSSFIHSPCSSAGNNKRVEFSARYTEFLDSCKVKFEVNENKSAMESISNESFKEAYQILSNKSTVNIKASIIEQRNNSSKSIEATKDEKEVRSPSPRRSRAESVFDAKSKESVHTPARRSENMAPTAARSRSVSKYFKPLRFNDQKPNPRTFEGIPLGKKFHRRKRTRFLSQAKVGLMNIAEGTCFFTLDFLNTLWKLKVYLIAVPLIAFTVCCIIFCAGWVHVNSYYYGSLQAYSLLALVFVILVFNLLILEPFVYIGAAAFSTYIWQTPLIINECLKRSSAIMGDIKYREYMVSIGLTGPPRTCFFNRQADPESATLFHLHDRIYKALTRARKLPNVTFHRGVYWLIFYTICAILLVNAESDSFSCYNQKKYIVHHLKLPTQEAEAIDIDRFWDYINDTLLPGLLQLKRHHNISVSGDEDERLDIDPGKDGFMGSMIITPVRIRQLRVQPPELDPDLDEDLCIPIPEVEIDTERSCNFEFSSDIEDKRTMRIEKGDKSPEEVQDTMKRLSSYREGINGDLLTSNLLLPSDGYFTVLHFDDVQTRDVLNITKATRWIDQHTRLITIDFGLINPGSRIASAFRLTVDFKRLAPFWYKKDFHFRFEQDHSYYFLTYLAGAVLVYITLHNSIIEITKLYRLGFWAYSSKIDSYIETTKIILVQIMIYAFSRQQNVVGEKMDSLRYGYLSKKEPEFVDLFAMAKLDQLYKMTGGLLVFICIFHIFGMLSKIQRLLVFIRLLKSAVYLFFMPTLTGSAFSCLAYLLFGTSMASFSSLSRSFLVVLQFFIRPRAIYSKSTEANQYWGPLFTLLLGFAINFFVLNFFIAFLNEAYSSIMSTVRMLNYKTRQKTKLEYVYEFLGIKSVTMVDQEDELKFKDIALEREYIRSLKAFAVFY